MPTRTLTQALKQSLALVDVRVLDHLLSPEAACYRLRKEDCYDKEMVAIESRIRVVRPKQGGEKS